MPYSHVKDRRELANLLNVSLRKMTRVLYSEGIEKCYSSFEIEKKNGGKRCISVPNRELKYIQKRIYLFFVNNREVKSAISHGFEQRRSIYTNASMHLNKKYLLNVDIEDFFGTINFGRVRGYLRKNNKFKFNDDISTVLAQLICYEGKLPQGASTSPIISNMICDIMDNRISKLSKKYKLVYTRYADDLSFSTNDGSFNENYKLFLLELEMIINNSGFRINHNKTRFTTRKNRQVVTGLTTNKKVNVERKYYKETRAMLHRIMLDDSFSLIENLAEFNVLEGKVAYINQIEYENKKKQIKLDEKHKKVMTAKEKMYQNLIMFKTFYLLEKPLILTEGKTDVLYIKGALNSLAVDYPDIVSYQDNKYIYNLSFFRRRNKHKFFFNLEVDGADTLCRIYDFYNDALHRDNLNKVKYSVPKLSNKRGVNPKYPVILLYDNELVGKKPLQKAINYLYSFDENRNYAKDMIIKHGWFHVESNLYIMAVPCSGKKTTEIEDLFESGLPKGLSKDMFSKDVFSNYQKYDFSGFKPLFDSYLNLLKHYETEVLKNKG